MSTTSGADRYLQMARQSLQHGRFDEAIVLVKQAIGLEPTSSEAYELLGVAHGRKGRVHDAVEALSVAVGLAPTSAGAHFNLGMAHQRAGNINGAMAELAEAIRLEPGNVAAQRALATMQAQAAPQPAPTPQGYGTVYPQPGPYAQPGPYGQPAPTAAGYGPYGAPSPYAPYPAGGYAAVQGYGAGPDTGGFSIENVVRLFAEPAAFLREQRGQRGLGAPIAMLLITLGVSVLVTMLASLAVATTHGGLGAGVGIAVIGVVVMLVIGLPVVLVCEFIWAGLVHLGVMVFHGQGGYAASFRASVYAGVPTTVICTLLVVIAALIPAGNILWTALQLATGLYMLVLLVIGLRELHGMSVGGAIVSALIPYVLAAVLAVLMGVALLGLVGSMTGLGRPRSTFGTPGSPWGGSQPQFGQPGFPGGMGPGRDPFGFPNTGPGMPSGPSDFGPRRIGPPAGFGGPPGMRGGPGFGGRGF